MWHGTMCLFSLIVRQNERWRVVKICSEKTYHMGLGKCSHIARILIVWPWSARVPMPHTVSEFTVNVSFIILTTDFNLLSLCIQNTNCTVCVERNNFHFLCDCFRFLCSYICFCTNIITFPYEHLFSFLASSIVCLFVNTQFHW